MENVSKYLQNKVKTTANGKHYFSLKEISEDLQFNFNNALASTATVLELFKATGFYIKNSMSFVYNEYHELEDVLLSKEALMFVSADIAKTGMNNAMDWKYIADELYVSTDKFYAEKRYLARKNYSTQCEQLNNVLSSLSYIRAKGIGKCLQEIYTIIISNYFKVTTKKELYAKKHLTEGQNYLDYISQVELNHLSWIIKNLTVFTLNNPYYDDILDAAKNYANQASEGFIKVFGYAPSLRPIHFDKPKSMLKNFDKLLKHYNLQSETSDENKDCK